MAPWGRLTSVMAGAVCVLGACTPLLPGTDRADAAPDTAVAMDTSPASDIVVTDGSTSDSPPPMDVRTDAASDVPVADTVGEECNNPTGLGGSSCYLCAASTAEQFLNHCTTAECMPFNTGSLPALDGGLPPLPVADGGAVDAAVDVPSDAGMPTADAPDGGPPSCASLASEGGTVVYATGSTAATLFLGQVAQALENVSPPVVVVYQSSGSCVGVAAMLDPADNMLTGTATYWTSNLAINPTSPAGQLTCTIPAGGVPADLGASDVFVDTCQSLPGGLSSQGLTDVQGPIEVMNFVVPQNSTTETISAEAAYIVFGYGGHGPNVSPWTNPSEIYQRGSASGTQGQIAAVIGVPRTQWSGIVESSSGAMLSAVETAGGMGLTVATSTLGILSSDYVDANRSEIRSLAFQDTGQHCAFWPDSTPTALDKANVRDGHYPLFGPLHLIARINSSGDLLNPGVQALLNVITGVRTLSNVDLIHIYATNGLVPACAMRVSKPSDDGAVQPSPPASDCGCYFEEQATGLVPPPGCVPCTIVANCADAGLANCNRFGSETTGYCEP